MPSFERFQRLPTWILVGFIVGTVVPWSNVFTGSYYNHQRLLQVVLLIAIGSCWVSYSYRRKVSNIIADKLWLTGFLLMVVGGGASVWMGLSAPAASVGYCHWLLLFSLFLSCASVASRDAFIVTAGFIFCQAVSVFLAMLYLGFTLLSGDPVNASVIYPGVDNIRFFNQIQVFVMPLLLFGLCRPKIGYFTFVCLTANFLLLLIGGARGALMVSFFIFIWVGWVQAQQRVRVYWALGALTIAAAAYIGMQETGQSIAQEIIRTGTSGRVDIWLEIIESLRPHHLLWGAGPGNYGLFTTWRLGHPHNSVLQVLFEWGGVALVGAGFIVSRLLYLTIRYIKLYPEDELTQAIAASLAASFAYSLIGGVIVMPVPQTLLFIFAGLLWRRVVCFPASASVGLHKTHADPRYALRAGLMVLILTAPYLWLVSNYYVQQTGIFRHVQGPAFWINGAAFTWPEQ